MSWCPRCDEVRDGAAGTPCRVCDAGLVDATPLRIRPSGQLLEVDRGSAPPARAETARVSRGTRARRAFTLALAATLVVTTPLVLSHRRHARPVARKSAAPASSKPPLGTAMSGGITVVSVSAITTIDLRTGATSESALPEAPATYVTSQNGAGQAYIDAQRTMWVPSGLGWAPTATEVDSAAWSADATELVILRSEIDPGGRPRYRIESRFAGLGIFTTNTVLETYLPVERVWPSVAGAVFLQVRDPNTHEPSIYNALTDPIQLVRRGYEILDVSPDDNAALVTPQKGPGLFWMSLDGGALRRVGPASFPAQTASFGPAGKAAITTPGAIWLLDVNAWRLQRVADTAGAEPLGPVVWHRDLNWFFYRGDAALWAVRVGNRTPVEAIRWTSDPTPLAIGFTQ